MTGKARVRATLGGRTPDRPPVLASTLAGAARMRGVAQRRFHTRADLLADCVVAASRALRLDGVYVSSDNWILHEALGGAVDFPEDDEPWGRGAVVDTWTALNALRVPDPRRAGRMPMVLEAAARVVADAGRDLYVEANIDSGPFMLATTLRGPERAMLDIHDCPKRFHELLAFTTAVVAAYGEAMAQSGADGIQFGESAASLASRAVFEEFVLPYDRQVISALKARGVHAFLHVCGQSSHLLGGLSRCDADCLEIDARVDLDDVFAAVGSRVCVRGNVDTALLLRGPPAAIREAALVCLAKTRTAGGRLILSPGCGVPKTTPPGHVLALVDAARTAAGATTGSRSCEVRD